MELVEGPTLGERIAQSPMPLEEALRVAQQIADALDVAHRNGIIHRDLKPANIKVRDDGVVKVLDFGLAKSFEPKAEPDDAPADSRTSVSATTRTGVVLGTAAYMAPEQAQGKPVDKRADIWAFGAVLFETLTRRAAFGGETLADVLAAVITREPEWSTLPAATPFGVRRLLRRCLQKDPARRLRDIGDARMDLDEALSGATDAIPVSNGRVAASSRRLWQSALVAALLAAVATGLWRQFHPVHPAALAAQPTARLSLGTRPLAILLHAATPAMALSPDGASLAYVAGNGDRGQLYVREMSSLEARPIEGAAAAFGPFFSPDGEWLAYFTSGALLKVRLAGGTAVEVCKWPEPWTVHGGSWGDDGTIVFAGNFLYGGRVSDKDASLWRVSAAGGAPEALHVPGEYYWPEVLPGSKAMVLTSIGTRTPVTAAGEGIWLFSFETGELRQLIPDGGIARYVRSGHLVYAWQGTLVAVPFDVERLQLTGPPIPVVHDAMMGLPDERRIAQFAVSHTGTLAYLPGPVLSNLRTLVWVDRSGSEESVPLEAREYEWVRLSPDGSRLALTIAGRYGHGDVWIYDLVRRTMMRLTTDDAQDDRPLWTPDGRRVAFRSRRAGHYSIFWRNADGTGADERVSSDSNIDLSAKAFSPDGKMLAFVQWNTATRWDVHLLLLEGQRTSKPLLQTPFTEGSPDISPDGRWIAYRSNETGQYEIYVRPFPHVETGKWQVSTGRGNAPVWSPDGREMFYRSPAGMMVVPVQAGDSFVAGAPRVLLAEKPLPDGAYSRFPLGLRNYDISRDGRRFIMLKDVEPVMPESARSQLTVVLNWFEELRRLVPGTR